MALFSTFYINPGPPVEPECSSLIAPKTRSYDLAEPGCRGRPDCNTHNGKLNRQHITLFAG